MPSPFGSDIYTRFGNKSERAIVGNFDPPVARVQANANATPVTARIAATSLGPAVMAIENAVGQQPLAAMTENSETSDTNNIVSSSKSSTAELLAVIQSQQDSIGASKVEPETSTEPTTRAKSEGATLWDDALVAEVEKGILGGKKGDVFSRDVNPLAYCGT
jgi:hypothetical protein